MTNLNKILPLMLVLVLTTFLSACSSTGQHHAKRAELTPLNKPVQMHNVAKVKNRLQQHFQQWQGTPYQYGGRTLKGVDCSAYVQNAYKSALGYRLPRTTRTQIKKGKKVSKSQLQVGDVVFFKIAKNSLHNGIYLGNGQFVHASSSKGVTVSELSNPYWRKTYLMARRVVQ